MEFEFEGIRYHIEKTSSQINGIGCYIKLPDGRYLNAAFWHRKMRHYTRRFDLINSDDLHPVFPVVEATRI